MNVQHSAQQNISDLAINGLHNSNAEAYHLQHSTSDTLEIYSPPIDAHIPYARGLNNLRRPTPIQNLRIGATAGTSILRSKLDGHKDFKLEIMGTPAES